MKDLQLIIDLEKSKGSREGLIQTVITYVRNGKVVTRKQWVRSEYAQHAKKNEQEKKERMVKQAEREEEKKKREMEESQEQYNREAEAEQRKMSRKQLQAMFGGLEHMDEVLKDYYKKVQKMRIDEEEEKREIEDKRKSDKRKEEKQEKEENRSAYNQQESTLASNRRELEIRGGDQ